MDLELRQLRCLVAMVDYGTFTDAAIELGVSQAAVSRNLMALERVLGVRLPGHSGHLHADSWQVTRASTDLIDAGLSCHPAGRRNGRRRCPGGNVLAGEAEESGHD